MFNYLIWAWSINLKRFRENTGTGTLLKPTETVHVFNSVYTAS
jgi:hypothetical protein